MNSKASFLLGVIAGLLCAFSIVSFRYLSLLPPDALSSSKQQLACTILHCDKPGRVEGTEKALVSLAQGLSSNPRPSGSNRPENPPEFRDPQFWRRLETDKKSEIEAIAKEILAGQEEQYQKLSKDLLLVQLISTGIDQKLHRTGGPLRGGEDKVLALGLEYVSKGKSVLTPPPASASVPSGK